MATTSPFMELTLLLLPVLPLPLPPPPPPPPPLLLLLLLRILFLPEWWIRSLPASDIEGMTAFFRGWASSLAVSITPRNVRCVPRAHWAVIMGDLVLTPRPWRPLYFLHAHDGHPGCSLRRTRGRTRRT